MFDERGIQLGYVRSERAAWLAPRLDGGTEVRAIFQEATDYGCAIRAAFDGDEPVLPIRKTVEPEPDWWPDEEWPDE